MGREEGRLSYGQFGIAVATWGIYKAPTMLSRRPWSNAYTCMAAVSVSGYGSPTGALQGCYSLNCGISGLERCPLEKQTS